MIELEPLQLLNATQLERCASLLVECFREHWKEAWPTIDDAREEIKTFFNDGDRFTAWAALDGDTVVGWVGGIKEYDGNVVELHPLAVDPSRWAQGIGRLLVEKLEEVSREIGALMIRAGTDDEDNMTSLSNVDLYDDLPSKIATIRNLKHHPYEFYMKLGYSIVGVVPDANGIGKPDIIMGKRL